MYEIKESRRELFDGTEITTYTRDVVSANILQVEAGTTTAANPSSGAASVAWSPPPLIRTVPTGR